jgi:predicted secreted protein
MRSRLAMALLMLPLCASAETVIVRPSVDLQGSPSLRMEVAARPGDEVRVELPTQSGTGYAWAGQVQGSAVREAGPATRTEAGSVGGPGTQTFAYVAQSAGPATLHFAYGRPWEPAEAAVARLTVGVEVSR